MDWYALFVIIGKEELIRSHLLNSFHNIECLLPKRLINERANGSVNTKLKLLFPGYIFIRLQNGMTFSNYYNLVKTPHLIRMLNFSPKEKEFALKKVKRENRQMYYELLSNEDFQIKQFKVIDKNEMNSIISLLDQNETIILSEIVIENCMPIVKSGPLMGQEHLICKIDKRKGRAKVVTRIGGENKLIDLGIKIIQSNMR
ncbi:antiterminator LoaP [Paenibacillus sp. FSL R7-0337]|uniref:antiterminator LoaP n=1 Tax=Paenibacillus sp. FSL R7-0337 TaxID=1926588 RepID=UPI00096C4F54|nr:antiterminator LoaP [Paenibacillus sp. FSL R7-0337]OMF98444.1 hypothetical protein BK147_09350 [Paenibacillus sp. FSL R7-0337]